MPEYKITLTVTRVATYETVMEFATYEEAEGFADTCVPDQLEVVDEATLDMTTEIGAAS